MFLDLGLRLESGWRGIPIVQNDIEQRSLPTQSMTMSAP